MIRSAASLLMARGLTASVGAAFVGAGLVVPLASPAMAQEVVQALPDPAAQELTDALQRLGRNPGSVPALVSAGRASLKLGDPAAALGFFSRAQAVAPGDGEVMAGLALIALDRGDAVTALELFTNADGAGHDLAPYAADRALAFDLVGRNADAQRLYLQALAEKDNDELTRRLALSYAIAGDAARSESTLLPLLLRQDNAGFRTRAFALAILGRGDEAVSIAETMLPERLSDRLGPYLRYMPRLTRAQQAAAANLGRFPAAAEIGADSPRIASSARETAPPAVVRPVVRPAPAPAPAPVVARPAAVASVSPASVSPNARANVDARLTPAGEPLGPGFAISAAPAPVATPAPAPTPAPTPVAPRASAELPAIAVAETNLPPAQASIAPGFAPTVQPTPAAQAEEERLTLAEAFSDFTLAGPARATVAPRAGAVDITAITPRREVPKPPPPPPPPPPPAHPSRHWVQLATGQDVAAFRFDWRRLSRKSAGLLDGRDSFRANWGQTNRLVTGPFASTKEAQQFVSQLAAAGIDAFRWTSDAGQEVAKIQ